MGTKEGAKALGVKELAFMFRLPSLELASSYSSQESGSNDILMREIRVVSVITREIRVVSVIVGIIIVLEHPKYASENQGEKYACGYF